MAPQHPLRGLGGTDRLEEPSGPRSQGCHRQEPRGRRKPSLAPSSPKEVKEEQQTVLASL